MRLYLLIFIGLILFSCSKQDDGSSIDSFPLNFRIADVNKIGITTYYYTDSITYQTNNDLVESLSQERDQKIDELLFGNQSGLENFAIKELSFTDPSNVTVNAFGNSNSSTYSEISGLGTTTIGNGQTMGFKINPDQKSLLSCYTIVNKRNIDSLFEGQFLPELDTLHDRDSTFAFQLIIKDDPAFVISACHPYNVNLMLSEFAQSNGVANNDRIIVHRTDFIFNKQ